MNPPKVARTEHTIREQPLRLRDTSPNPPEGIDPKAAKEEFKVLSEEIGRLQELLYSASTHSLLVVMQGMDTSGKDGTIRKVFSQTDPLGCEATPFKAPTESERAHDFLWRIHARTPARGILGIFNRSHYEDVLVARVRKLVPKDVWQARYAAINDFERLLVDSGTAVVKIFLHIDEAEQKERLLAREQDVEKSWKLNAGDWKDRQFWNGYLQAYDDVFAKTSTDHAPWHVIPANKKWYRNLAVARIVKEALALNEDDWKKTLSDQSRARREEIEEFRREEE